MQRSTAVGRAFALALLSGLLITSSARAENVERVSVTSAEVQDVDSSSSGSYITPDGRYVVFQTAANLDPADTNNTFDIYVRDRVTGTTARVSIPDPGVTGSPTNANAGCFLGRPGVRYCSDDGRHVVFQSSASNLVNGDHNGEQHVDGLDVFVHDRDADGNGIYDEPGVGKTHTARVSVSSGEGEWHEFSIGLDTYSGSCSNGSISADGKYVAFECDGDPFSPGNDHGTVGSNVYRRDRDNDGDFIYDESGNQCIPISPNVCIDTDQANTELVSKLRCNCTNTQGDGYSHDPAISGNGRFVAFVSASSLLDYDTVFDSDSNNRDDVYVRDMTGKSMRASVDTNENEIVSGAGDPTISYDGRYIAFTIGGSLTVPRSTDNNNVTDVYVRDRGNSPSGDYIFTFGKTSRVSLGTYVGLGPINAFVQLDTSSDTPFISPDGKDIAFITKQNGVQCGFILPCADQNGKNDVYVRHLNSGDDWSTSNTDQWTYRATRTQAGGDANGDSIFPSVATGGNTVAFGSVASDLITPDANGAISDVYVNYGVVASAPFIQSVVSQKVHGGVGAFDVNLPISGGTAGIEPRANGPTRLVFTFSEPVHYTNSGSLYLASNLIVDSYFVSGNQVTFDVHGAVNASCGWFQVGDFADAEGHPITGLTTIYYRSLQGDGNQTGLVATTDRDNAKSFSGQSAAAGNFTYDITADGEVDAADILRIKARLNNTVSSTCN